MRCSAEHPEAADLEKGRSVFIIDDDDVFHSRLARAFAARGWDAQPIGNGEAAIEAAKESPPDLAIVDLRLPGIGGLEIVRALRQIDDTTCIIVLTGYGSIPTALTATRLGANHYMGKPADADEILSAYERIVSGQSGPTENPMQTVVPSLARVEWEHIQRVLDDCDGNISQAAKLLGLHRRSLQRKLSKYPPKT